MRLTYSPTDCGIRRRGACQSSRRTLKWRPMTVPVAIMKGSSSVVVVLLVALLACAATVEAKEPPKKVRASPPFGDVLTVAWEGW